MENIWVYDFDGTIYDGDSSIDFFFFCLRKKFSLIKYLPMLIFYTFWYALKKITVKEYKEKVFQFLKNFANIDELVDEFWQKNSFKINQFFLDDLNNPNRPLIAIISASPQFLINGYAKNLKNVSLIATDMDKKTGIIHGENCKGEEKVVQFEKEFKNTNIAKFYSDSKSDEPLAKKAQESFIVLKGQVKEWKERFFIKEKQKKISFGLFLFFFTFYLILGIYLSYLYVPKLDFFFGSDMERVIGDMTGIFNNHYRVRVHPIYILLLQPITLMLSGLTINKLLAALIFCCFISSLSVVLIYKSASIFLKNEKLKLLITAIFGFSFSEMFFSAVIESFPFASFILIFLWYFVIKVLKNEKIPKNYLLYLFLLGTASLGITVTNFVIYLIALFVLWLAKKIKIKQIIIVILTAFLTTACLSYVQNYAWHNTPTIFEKNNLIAEKRFAIFTLSTTNFKNVIQKDFVENFFANDVEKPKNVRFGELNYFNITLAIIFYLIILINLFKNFKKNKILNIGLLLALLFNFGLHLFYGNGETFLYTCHFNYLIILLLIINYQENEKKRDYQFLLLSIVAGLEVICNLKVFKQLLTYASKYLKPTYYRNFKNPWLFIGIVVILVLIYLLSYLIWKMVKKIIDKRVEDKLSYVIGCLICLIFISLIFISIETIPKYQKIFNIPINIQK